MRALVVAAALALVASPLAAQSASFVYTLGHDTVAIEQYTRTANAVEGEMVQRAGAVVSRLRYRLTLGRDGRPTGGTLARLQADGTPFPTGARETRYTITRDSVARELIFADSTQRSVNAVRGAVIPFPTFIYGPTEVLAALRRRGVATDSLPVWVGSGPATGYIGLEAAGGDTLRLRGQVPYQMRLRFDARDRLLSVDGSFTTNKVIATRSETRFDLAAIARTMRPTGALSARATARSGFGAGGIVLVDYGRPLVRERSVWGGTLVPFDSVWRAGANDATHLFTTRTLTFGDVALTPGSYTLWIQHTRDDGTFLIVNRQTGQWGTQYDAAQDITRVRLEMAAAPTFLEEFTITLRPAGPGRGALDIAWGDRVGTVMFGVTR